MANIPTIHTIKFPLSFLWILPQSTDGNPREIAEQLIRWGYVNRTGEAWKQQLAAFQKLSGCDDIEAAVELKKMERAAIAAQHKERTLPFYYQTIEETATAIYKGMGFEWTDEKGKSRADIPLEKYVIDSADMIDLEERVPGTHWTKDAPATVHRGIVNDLRNEEWEWGLFAVYSGLRSKFGSKKWPVRIMYEEIMARCNGYRSTKLVPPGLVSILTYKQIRNRVDKLMTITEGEEGEEKSLIQTWSKRHGRERFYWQPYRLTDPEADGWIADREAGRKRKSVAVQKQQRRERVTVLTDLRLSDPRPKKRPARKISRRPAAGSTSMSEGESSTTSPELARATMHDDISGTLLVGDDQRYSIEKLIETFGEGSWGVQKYVQQYESTFGADGKLYYSVKIRKLEAPVESPV